MQIGFLYIATAQSGDLPTLARRAETIGFDSLWIPEHPIIPRGKITPYPFGGDLPEHYGRWTDPFIALTVAAAVTTKIKLATGICLLPEREPIVTAKTIASLDYYSGGRVILGIGAGWLKEETEVMGTKFTTRWQKMREISEAMRRLWREDSPSYQGNHINFPAVRCEPKPKQAGGPRILLGGHGEKALNRIARSYDGWCPIVQDPKAYGAEAADLREMFRAAGRDPATLQLSPFIDPEDGNLSTATLKAYKDAGVTRLVLFSQKMTDETANGANAAWLEKSANIVERAKAL
jgi:probable F420-dependent oxidoreductase